MNVYNLGTRAVASIPNPFMPSGIIYSFQMEQFIYQLRVSCLGFRIISIHFKDKYPFIL